MKLSVAKAAQLDRTKGLGRSWVVEGRRRWPYGEGWGETGRSALLEVRRLCG